MKQAKHKLIEPTVKKFAEWTKNMESQLDELVNAGWKIVGYAFSYGTPTVLLQKWE